MQTWQKKLPMWLTWARMVAIFPLLLLLWPNLPRLNAAAVVLYFFAGLTDYFDGYFARKFEAHSNEGKLLDPVADKILVTGLLVVLVQRGSVEPVMVVLILGRDLLIGALRSLAALRGQALAAQSSGKIKTAIQMLGLPLCLAENVFDTPLVGSSGYWILWIATVLSITSAWSYLRAAPARN